MISLFRNVYYNMWMYLDYTMISLYIDIQVISSWYLVILEVLGCDGLFPVFHISVCLCLHVQHKGTMLVSFHVLFHFPFLAKFVYRVADLTNLLVLQVQVPCLERNWAQILISGYHGNCTGILLAVRKKFVWSGKGMSSWEDKFP